MFHNLFFSRKLCLLLENVEKYLQPGRPQMTIRRMRISSQVPKATDTHSDDLIYIAFPLQQWLNERASMLRYTHIICLVLFLNY